MKYYCKLIIILCLCHYNTAAQSISGQIIDNEYQSPLEDAIIKNASKNIITYTDGNGEFSIHAKVNDTIVISKMSYYNYIYIVRGTEQKHVILSLRRDAIHIDNVEVLTDYGRYKRDSLEKVNIYQKDLFRKEPTGFAAVGSPATAIANIFSKKHKTRKKFQNNFWQWEEEKFQNIRYNLPLIISLTKLSEEEAGKFMERYPIAQDFARAATDLEIKMWIMYNFKQWNKNNINVK